MRRPLIRILIGLQLLALVLAWLHMPAGLLTDEAKYVLGIPYPHPPVLRTVLALTRSWPGQELFWRIIFATITVHAVWIVWDLAAMLPRGRRLLLCFVWLSAAPVVLQAGTIMLVVPTALLGLVFLRLAADRGDLPPRSLAALAWLWLLALGTAYQSVLYAPLAWAAMSRTRSSFFARVLAFCVPMVLLLLWTLANPLAIASMLAVSTQDSVLSPWSRISNILWVWTLAGGAVSAVGLWGVLRVGDASLRWSMALVLLFIAVSGQHYYAILLVPLFLGGVLRLACHRRLLPRFLAWAHAVSTVLLLAQTLPGMMSIDRVRPTVSYLVEQGMKTPLLIAGSFGHQWQYHSPVPVVRYNPALATDIEHASDFLVCTRPRGCEEEIDTEFWTRVAGAPMEAWTRK